MFRRSAVFVAFMMVVTLPLRAQGGCVDSPEDPTLALALLGCAGAFAMGLRQAYKRGR